MRIHIYVYSYELLQITYFTNFIEIYFSLFLVYMCIHTYICMFVNLHNSDPLHFGSANQRFYLVMTHFNESCTVV